MSSRLVLYSCGLVAAILTLAALYPDLAGDKLEAMWGGQLQLQLEKLTSSAQVAGDGHLDGRRQMEPTAQKQQQQQQQQGQQQQGPRSTPLHDTREGELAQKPPAPPDMAPPLGAPAPPLASTARWPPQEEPTDKEPPLPVTAKQKKLLCMLRKTLRAERLKTVSPEPEPYGRLRKKHRVCAVVSNSGVIRAHAHGAEIDSADLVIRFNNAPLTLKWQTVAGVKDDVRVVNQHFAPEVLQSKKSEYVPAHNGTFLVIPMSPTTRLDEFHKAYLGTEILEVNVEMLHDLARTLREMYPKGDKQWAAEHVSEDPTSGAFGMVYALDLCREVRVYGMAQTQMALGSPYHYYTNWGDANYNKWHDSFHAEKDLWRHLASTPGEEIERTDRAVIPGFASANCPGSA